MELAIYILAVFIAVSFIFFMAYIIDFGSVYGDEREMEKRGKARENPKYIIYLLLALGITILNVLLMRVAPNRPTAVPLYPVEFWSELDYFYAIMFIFYSSLLFRCIFLGEKLLLFYKNTELGKKFLVSAIFVNICVWPLVIFVKTIS